MNTHIVKTTDDTTKKHWNRLAAHPLQTWEWSEAREALGVTCIRVIGPDCDGRESVFLATVHPLPLVSGTIFYVAKSPIPSDEVLAQFSTIAKAHNCVYIKWEPHAPVSKRVVVSDKLRKSSMRLFPDWTQVLDMTPDESTLLANLKSKTRYNIRLAAKRGVVVKEVNTPEGFEQFFALYEETEKRQHHYGHTKTYHQQVFTHMHPAYSHVLIAYYDSIPLAAYHLFFHNNTLYYPYGGSTDTHKEVMAPNLLMWEAIRLGKRLGATLFDMWGSLSPEQSENQKEAWYGFTRFKKGYNTDFVESVGSYDQVLVPIAYPLLTAAWHARSRWLERF